MTRGPAERPRPPDFEHYEDLELWVLDHGLPTLPATLGEDEQIPIAYWTGPDYGVVLSRYRDPPDNEKRINPPGTGDICDDHQAYYRSATGWDPGPGAGGTCGTVKEPMQPPPLPERFASLDGASWRTGSIAGGSGLVGTAAHTLELTDRHGVTHRAVDAPVGLVIVCFDAEDDVRIRVLDEHGEVLADEREAATDRFSAK